MKKVFVCWDSKVTAAEVEAIANGVRQMSTLCYDREFVVYGGESWSDGEYSSGRWYVDHARKTDDGKLDASSLIELYKARPLLEDDPYVGIYFTVEEMVSADGSECFDLNDVQAGVAVQSVARFRQLSAYEEKLCLERVFRHELGHLLNMAAHGRHNGHCAKAGCTMRTGKDVGEWIKFALEENRFSSKFCPQCLTDLRRYESRLKGTSKHKDQYKDQHKNQQFGVGAKGRLAGNRPALNTRYKADRPSAKMRR
ncbi:hypothetical protein IKE82_00590 [Candidatus Saccharibacteria bacterium]|nr:hypothetical protein [Candidatus Saccharibacteria bacterium]